MAYLLWLGVVALGALGVKWVNGQIEDKNTRTAVFVGYLVIVGYLAFVLPF